MPAVGVHRSRTRVVDRGKLGGPTKKQPLLPESNLRAGLSHRNGVGTCALGLGGIGTGLGERKSVREHALAPFLRLRDDHEDEESGEEDEGLVCGRAVSASVNWRGGRSTGTHNPA